MNRFEAANGFDNAPADDRDDDDPEYTVDTDLSEQCSPGIDHDPLR